MDEPFLPRDYNCAPSDLSSFDPQTLFELANTRMPFGKYSGWRLIDLPEAYVLWFKHQGFPQGQLGKQLAELCDIKANGLEFLFDPLRDTSD